LGISSKSKVKKLLPERLQGKRDGSDGAKAFGRKSASFGRRILGRGSRRGWVKTKVRRRKELFQKGAEGGQRIRGGDREGEKRTGKVGAEWNCLIADEVPYRKSFRQLW